jgi:hypothetical protein
MSSNPFTSSNNSRPNNNNNNNPVRRIRDETNYFVQRPKSKPNAFEIKPTDFPELLVNKSTEPQSFNPVNYIKALSTSNEISKEENIVQPGWIQYKFNKETRNVETAYGSKTASQLRRERRKQLENDTNYLMQQSIIQITKNWNQYKAEYDNINGEGSYDDVYYLSPLYPESDEELEIADYDDSEDNDY